MKKRFSSLLIPVVLFVCASCATGNPPFASAEDTAIKQKLVAALGDYNRTLTVTVSGGRVYYEGELHNFVELQHAIALAKDTPGVTAVVDHVYLTDVGNAGRDSPGRR